MMMGLMDRCVLLRVLTLQYYLAKDATGVI